MFCFARFPSDYGWLIWSMPQAHPRHFGVSRWNRVDSHVWPRRHHPGDSGEWRADCRPSSFDFESSRLESGGPAGFNADFIWGWFPDRRTFNCTNEYHRLVSKRQTMRLEFDSLQRRLVIAKPGIAIHSKLTDSFVQVVAPVYNCKRAEANACTPKWNHNLFWALSIAAT